MNVSNLFISSSEQIPGGYFLLKSTTLAAPASSFGVSGLTGRKNLMVDITTGVRTNATVSALTFNSDAGASYYYRRILDAVDGGEQAAKNNIVLDASNQAPYFLKLNINNLTGSSKYGTFSGMVGNNTSVLNGSFAWVGTAAQIDTITITGTQNFPIGTFMAVYGAD